MDITVEVSRNVGYAHYTSCEMHLENVESVEDAVALIRAAVEEVKGCEAEAPGDADGEEVP